MDPSFIRTTLITAMRHHRKSVEEARTELIRGLRLTDTSVVDSVVADIREESRKNVVLDVPKGVRLDVVTDDVRLQPWYTGPEEGDRYWPALRSRLESSPMASVIDEIDQASTKVVANFADPGVRKLKKKGLVVGYVQSGKTANYTAVMAKAADAGYQTFIVLSGMHNNLRRQTQVRITKDLGSTEWFPLTNEAEDFGSIANGSALLAMGVHSVAVVKKNASRLRRLRDWLKDIDEDVRARSPILILDDEADQATPNSAAARDELTKINELVRQIWAEVPTGSYVGYTATPFANVFMDPDDEEDLYPSDFILDLPRSADYFGAERIFGRVALHDADEPDPGLDMVRDVPEDEAEALQPPYNSAERLGFDPEIPDSLIDAMRWFLLSTAVRRWRGQTDAHSSMLIHTTAFVAPHFRMKSRVEVTLQGFAKEIAAGDHTSFRVAFEDEMGRVHGVTDEKVPTWSDVSEVLVETLSSTRVVVDNGISDDRLDYARLDAQGQPLVETVIAIGGGTLSRGLTLEGLIVSYFTRTSNTYDTLLQMGRWFGYRHGYEDLPRIWMPDDLRQDFEFLALVEEEIRQDMRRLEELRVTPREFGVRVRAHPGRLSITAKGKMFHADLVQISYSGQRHQTIVLHERDSDALARNVEAAARLLATARQQGTAGIVSPSKTQFFDVTAETITEFLAEFEFHKGQPGLRSDHVVGWINRAAPDSRWNVVVIGNSKQHRRPDGTLVHLGEVDLGLPDPVPMVNRAPLSSPDDGSANIKALLSQQDWVADFDPELVNDLRTADQSYEDLRREHGDGNGLLIVYPVSNKSVPLRVTQTKARRHMTAALPQIGLGIVFPESIDAARSTDADYYSVHPDWQAVTDEEVDFPTDTEGSTNLDAMDVRREEYDG